MSFELRLGSCLAPEAMPSLADKSIDVVIADPPYSEHVHSKSKGGLTQDNRAGAKGRISVHRDLGFESITQAEIEVASDEFARVARRWVLVFCDVESSHLWAGELRAAGLEYVRTLAWVKIGGAPQFTGDRPAVAFEAIVLAHPKGRKSWNGGGKAGIYSVPTAIDRDRSGLDARMHPTQKPVALMEELILDFTNPGETILDPYAGSGTTGVAALRLGREFLGFELNAEHHAAATDRLRKTAGLPVAFQADARQGALF